MENTSLPPRLFSQNRLSAFNKSALVCTSTPDQLIQSNSCISIVSNSHLLREALGLLLKTHQSTHLINSYAGNIDIVANVINPLDHLVLLDSGIGQDLTIIRIQQWRSLEPFPHVVVLELKNDTDLILDCIEAGAHAYALQGASSTEIRQVIDQVYQGGFQCPPEITTKLFARLSQPKISQPKISQPKTLQPSREKTPLTRRELEVLHYVAKEYSDREIATQLVIEVRTVKHHVHNILQKLSVRHRWEAAQLALKNCWLDLKKI
jgi:DNA-binding NarL/FixJ family response regulator